MDQQSISTLARDMIESSEAFADQFDRSSQHFHHGLQTPVPVGGARVPETMPTVYPEKIEDLNGYINDQQQQDNYGAAFDACMAQREFFNGPFKKVLSRVSMLGDALHRHREAFKHQGKVDDPKQVQAFERNLQKEFVRLREGVAEVQTMIHSLPTQYRDKYEEVFKLFEQSQSEFTTKEQVAEFNFAAKRITALAFKDSQTLMEEIKLIKKGGKPIDLKQQQSPQKLIQEESKQQH